MKVVQAILGDRKDVESIFYSRGGPAKLLHASSGVQEDPKSSFHYWAGLVHLWHGIFIASSQGPFEKSEKRAWYPLLAHALNFPTFREFRIIPCTSACRDVRYVYLAVYFIIHC